jgi:mono/diheme cytochrome c family protein
VNHFRYLCASAVLSLLLSSCSSRPPGQPLEDAEAVAPNQIMEFTTLYAQNCAGCHGAQGRGGAAIALADPVYLAIVDEASMRKVIANGVHGTSMSAFAQSAGGMLTDKQVDAIASGIFSVWARKGILDGSNPPSYAANNTGNAASGELVYGTYCASCHGPQGQGTPKGSAVTNDSFLALVSDQGLRTIVIAGRPELGAPDWRSNLPGKPMTNQQVTDVVAWLASRRVQNPGQPYSASNIAQHQESNYVH